MDATSRSAVICGLGASLPPHVVTNDDVIERGSLDTTDKWIRARTGIMLRRQAERGTGTGSLAVAAGLGAMRSAPGISPDMVLVATTTPDRRCPATAPSVAHRLDLSGVPAFDLSAVCSGFLYGLSVATALINSGQYQNPMIIGAEKYSSIVDPFDRDTAAIFGDGAAAVILRRGQADEPGAVVATYLGADGQRSDLIGIAAGGSLLPETVGLDRDQRYFRMRGQEVYRHAVQRMTDSSLAILSSVGWSAESVEAFIGHQANQRILDSVADRVGINQRYRIGNIREVGNTAAASIPIAMADASSRGAVKPGARTLLTAFGGGLTWGASALSWPDVKAQWCEPIVAR
ncbi:beta-ketoacyl-ACP synthase III [Streptomyces roseus]|uniref:beta-ketoacyl-ACP synthase III n=1 Tax=Streptomyces roseus TaxID=66430 RepID=UPI0037FF6BDF